MTTIEAASQRTEAIIVEVLTRKETGCGTDDDFEAINLMVADAIEVYLKANAIPGNNS